MNVDYNELLLAIFFYPLVATVSMGGQFLVVLLSTVTTYFTTHSFKKAVFASVIAELLLYPGFYYIQPVKPWFFDDVSIYFGLGLVAALISLGITAIVRLIHRRMIKAKQTTSPPEA